MRVLLLLSCLLAMAFGQGRFLGTLNQAQVVPAPAAVAGATDTIMLELTGTNPNFLQGSALLSGLSGAVVTFDIQQAAPGANGPIIFDLTNGGANIPQDGVTFDIAPFAVTDQQVIDLEMGLYYVDVTTAMNPAGELRAQLLQNNAAYFDIPVIV